MTLVLDASVALSWCFEDETSADLDAIGHRVVARGALVPTLWRLEVANGLEVAGRRGRIAAPDIAARLDWLGALPIDEDAETSKRAWREILALAQLEGLTLYDAAYLELAIRAGLPLATADRRLARAAAGYVDVLPAPQSSV